MRTLAVDYGLKRLGLAMSDEGGKWATPLDVIAVSDPRLAIPEIVRVIESEHVARLLLGLPLNMDGTMSPMAKQVQTFGCDVLAASTRKPEMLFVDERLSSFDAEQQLNARKRAGEKLTRKRRKEQLDGVAAAVFLQEFLDGKLKAINP